MMSGSIPLPSQHGVTIVDLLTNRTVESFTIGEHGLDFGDDGKRNGFGRVAAEIEAGWCEEI